MQHMGTLRVGEESNIFFEWADQDLAKFLQSDQASRPEPLLQQLMQLASALHYLHYQIVSANGSKIVCCHMDLKPNNILVVKEEGYPVGKWMIADFGISVFKNKEMISVHDQAATLTADSKNPPQRPPGPYQAPEVHQTWGIGSRYSENKSSGQIGRKGDIWSLGCIFATVLAFALGGKTYLAELEQVRSTFAGVSLDNDHFYQHTHSPTGSEAYSAPKMVVKPEIERWFNMLLQKHHLEWVGRCVTMIHRTMAIDQDKRPSAAEVEKELISILHMPFDKAAGTVPTSTRQHPTISNPPAPVDEKLVEDVSENIDAFPKQALVSYSAATQGTAHFKVPPTTKQERTKTSSTLFNAPQVPASSASQHQSRRSSFPSPSWNFQESGKFTLNTSQYHVGRKATANVVAICPTTERIVLSYKKGTLVLCRNLADSMRTLKFGISEVSNSQWRHVHVSRSLLVLRGASNQNVSWLCLLLIVCSICRVRLLTC